MRICRRSWFCRISVIRKVDRPTGRTVFFLLITKARCYQRRYPEFKDLAARIESYELAFRMQAEMPPAVNIEKEPQETRELYGIGHTETDSLGRRCLMARRLVEKGVRFVQVYAGGWDSHDFIEEAHRNRMRAVDKPIAGLLKDLKRTGLLDSTLVIWSGEFGRSPDNPLHDSEPARPR